MIVFTNGCFDILHVGHVDFFKKIKELYPDSKLIVGLNSDHSIKKIKGENRPINCELYRKKVLESIKYIDEVIIFEEESPESLIKEISPDVLIKGGDYMGYNILGQKLTRYGVTVIKNSFDISTTKLIDHILNSFGFSIKKIF